MNDSAVQASVGIATAVLVAAFLYWLAGAALLAAFAGLLWGGCVSATLYVYHRHPSHLTGEGWKDGRWAGLSVAGTTGAALLGVGPYLSVPEEVRFGIQVLVLGAGYLGYVSGTLAEIEKSKQGG